MRCGVQTGGGVPRRGRRARAGRPNPRGRGKVKSSTDEVLALNVPGVVRNVSIEKFAIDCIMGTLVARMLLVLVNPEVGGGDGPVGEVEGDIPAVVVAAAADDAGLLNMFDPSQKVIFVAGGAVGEAELEAGLPEASWKSMVLPR